MAGKHVEEVLGKESCAVRDRLLEKIAKESAENDRLRAQVNEVREVYELMFEFAMNQLDKVEELTREKDSALKAAQKAKKIVRQEQRFSTEGPTRVRQSLRAVGKTESGLRPYITGKRKGNNAHGQRH